MPELLFYEILHLEELLVVSLAFFTFCYWTSSKIMIPSSDLSVIEKFSLSLAHLNHLNLSHQHIVLDVLTTATEACLNQRYDRKSTSYRQYSIIKAPIKYKVPKTNDWSKLFFLRWLWKGTTVRQTALISTVQTPTEHLPDIRGWWTGTTD